MYYLPIYLNNRRMHVVKLEPRAQTKETISERTIFSFLINSSDTYDLFSLPSEHVQLIRDNGKDIDLVGKKLKIEKLTTENDIPIYNITIPNEDDKEEAKEECNQEVSQFVFSGTLGSSMDNGPYTLKVDSWFDKEPEEYILQFTYKEKASNNRTIDYIGSIRIFEYSNKDKFFEASLDFGSEASQVGSSTCVEGVNMNIRDAFINMVKGADINRDYWQGRSDDDSSLYKSIYHIHRKPGITMFGDLPMCNGENTFIQSLLQIDADTQNFILLPNLKLIEQLRETLQNQDQISFNGSSFLANDNITTDLTNRDLNEGILRQILCNFLSVVMNSHKNKEYLYFILLVPNVYRQDKVHKLITGLYKDFYLLKEKEEFRHYKGIEVSIVSESDASFFGVRARNQEYKDFPWIENAKYLIIDAGKGTTDFSILVQEGGDLSNFKSLYRSGIPASGHVLTYAFYEALRSYFYRVNFGENFDNIIRTSATADRAQILRFANLLEEFKTNFSKMHEDAGSEDKMEQDAKKIRNINDLNSFLQTNVSTRRLIPGMTNFLREKIETMTDLLKNSIVAYAKNKGVICNKVILTGRAFMLDPFRKHVIDMLCNEGVVNSDTDIFYNSGITKKICTRGAMDVGKQGGVNKNSNMLGAPNLVEVLGVDVNQKPNLLNNIKAILRKIRGLNKGVEVDMSYDFFYRGVRLNNVRNAIFSLSGVKTRIGDGNNNNLIVYYVGDGYIYKHGNTYRRINETGTISGIDDNLREQLVKESIFPFNIKAFGLDAAVKQILPIVDTKEENNAEEKEKNKNKVENEDTKPIEQEITIPAHDDGGYDL